MGEGRGGKEIPAIHRRGLQGRKSEIPVEELEGQKLRPVG